MSKNALKVEIITSKFNQMLAELAAIDPKIEFSDVVKNEAAAVIGIALANTRAASASSIRNRVKTSEWTTFNGKKYKSEVWLLPNKIYRAIQERRRRRMEMRLAARGISKQSWLHLASSLGKQIAEVPAYVVNANSRGMQFPIDGQHSEAGSGSGYALTIMNFSPVVQAAGGRGALLYAMGRRTRYFEGNMKHHFYRTLETRAAKYPGIFTSPVPAAAD